MNDLDTLFSELVWPGAPAGAQEFLCQLMAASREGHLCLRSQKHPLPDALFAEDSPVIRDGDRYYLHRNWVLETTILRHLLRLRQTSPRPIAGWSLLPQQAEAIHHARDHSLTLVSGGPGTGKTFTAGQLIQSFIEAMPGGKVKIAAPTGKAAERLAQASGVGEVSTLHRLLHLQPGRSRLFSERMIDADLILVDEASMIDASLFAHLLSAVPSGARLVIFGDANQLPPIDGGGVFADLADLWAIRLEGSHRTQDEGLLALYEAARTGDTGPLCQILEPLPPDLIQWMGPMLGSLSFQDRPDPAQLLKRLEELRVICPLRKGPRGVDAINAQLLDYQRKNLSFGQWWAAPIIVTSNDAGLSLSNGTGGVVIGQYRGGRIPFGTEEAILTDGRSFPLHRLPSYEIAFALSVHKSQGSEFQRVVCCLPPGSEEFGREALYTALTRAKSEVRLAGDRLTLEAMMSHRSKQDNGLKERLK